MVSSDRTTCGLAFHLALPVHDLKAARSFYAETLGCSEGRSADRWVDFDFFGHQVSLHLASRSSYVSSNPVDGDEVPAHHFGVILEWSHWHEMAELLTERGVVFRIAPRIRFAGEFGEQATMFFDDPSGNAIELKAFRDSSQIFEREPHS